MHFQFPCPFRSFSDINNNRVNNNSEFVCIEFLPLAFINSKQISLTAQSLEVGIICKIVKILVYSF